MIELLVKCDTCKHQESGKGIANISSICEVTIGNGVQIHQCITCLKQMYEILGYNFHKEVNGKTSICPLEEPSEI